MAGKRGRGIRLRDCYDALFGMFVAVTAMWALIFVAGCAAGELDEEEMLIAMFGAVICQLLWELRREKPRELHIEIYKLPDGRQIRKERWE